MTRWLALELSTPRASLAAGRDGDVLAETSWDEAAGRPVRLFDTLPYLLEKAGLRPADLELYVAGRGPGGFTGMRVAVTAAQALALPAGARVLAVASGEALAAAVAAETGAEHVAVCGDARRGKLWWGLFARRPEGVAAAGPWALAEPGALADLLPAGAVAVTSDWPRVSALLQPRDRAHLAWSESSRFPLAADLARIALRRLAAAGPFEPVEPIYLHPPV